MDIQKARDKIIDMISKLSHRHNDDDPWYSCPMHPEYGGPEDDNYCNCGYETRKERLEKILELLRD